MKDLDSALLEFKELKDLIIEETIKYNEGEEIDREMKHESGDFSISLYSSPESDWEYLLACLSKSIVQKFDTSKDNTYLRCWYNELESSKDIYRAVGKAVLDHEIMLNLKEFIENEKISDN